MRIIFFIAHVKYNKKSYYKIYLNVKEVDNLNNLVKFVSEKTFSIIQ